MRRAAIMHLTDSSMTTLQTMYTRLITSPTAYGWLLGFLILGFVLYQILSWLLSPLTSPLRNLPGPPSPSWVYGNFIDIFKADNSVLHEKWLDQYGDTIKYRVLFGVCLTLSNLCVQLRGSGYRKIGYAL